MGMITNWSRFLDSIKFGVVIMVAAMSIYYIMEYLVGGGEYGKNHILLLL